MEILRQHIKNRAILLLQIDEAKGQLRSLTKLHGGRPQELHNSDGQEYNLNTFETYLRRMDKLLQLSIERDGLSMTTMRQAQRITSIQREFGLRPLSPPDDD